VTIYIDNIHSRRASGQVEATTPLRGINANLASRGIGINAVTVIHQLYAFGGSVIEMMYFLDIVDKRLRQALPIVVKQMGGEFLGGREFHCQLTHVVIVVEIVLSAIAYNVPVAPVYIASVVYIAETHRVYLTAGIHKSLADLFPPLAVFVEALL
jgi:hypothetical protein